jgi:hypothetical protein
VGMIKDDCYYDQRYATNILSFIRVGQFLLGHRNVVKSRVTELYAKGVVFDLQKLLASVEVTAKVNCANVPLSRPLSRNVAVLKVGCP